MLAQRSWNQDLAPFFVFYSLFPQYFSPNIPIEKFFTSSPQNKISMFASTGFKYLALSGFRAASSLQGRNSPQKSHHLLTMSTQHPFLSPSSIPFNFWKPNHSMINSSLHSNYMLHRPTYKCSKCTHIFGMLRKLHCKGIVCYKSISSIFYVHLG